MPARSGSACFVPWVGEAGEVVATCLEVALGSRSDIFSGERGSAGTNVFVSVHLSRGWHILTLVRLWETLGLHVSDVHVASLRFRLQTSFLIVSEGREDSLVFAPFSRFLKSDFLVFAAPAGH